MPLSKVIIVGAGPSGLLLALLLARAGVPVDVLEQSRALDTNPRASHYTSESCAEFDRAGILDEVRAQGFTPDGVSWRRLDDERRTRLVAIRNAFNGAAADNTATAAATGAGDSEEQARFSMVCLPLHRLGKILEEHVLAQPAARIYYGYKVVEIGDETKGKAWVRVEKEDGGSEVREADYVVGCDGANSTVRRKLFGEMVYPGFTWDKQIVATNVYYDFGPYDYDDSQFFVHPEHW